MMADTGTSLVQRGRQCRARFERMAAARRGVPEHVAQLEAQVESRPIVLPPHAGQRAVRASGRPTHRLAVLLRGQAYRGSTRETFFVDERSLPTRAASQMLCLQSLLARLIEPFEASGHHVDVFMTVYRQLGGPLSALLAPFADRVVSLTAVLQRSTPSQLLPLAAAVRAFLAWCTAHRQSYAAVVVTRFDVYLKTDMRALLGAANKIDGFRFLWREAGGHWRHHSDPSTAERTFSARPWRDWRKSNPRAPDALIAFPFAYTRCFLGSVRNELFPLRNESRPLSFLHNAIVGINRALPAIPGRPAGIQYLLRGQFDSNPCRATCMLNPVYDLLPRMLWITASGICQTMEDFTYDPASDSLCCPSPNYCCPNSVSSCADPAATYFGSSQTGSSTATAAMIPMIQDVIIDHWPLHQNRPFRWEVTVPASKQIAHVWRSSNRSGRGTMQLRLRAAAQIERDARSQRTSM